MPSREVVASVIIPVHNRRDKLARCLSSLASQHPGTPGFEVVVVDDGSTDGTAEVVEAARGGRGAGHSASWVDLVLKRQIPRRGPAAARNAGITVSRGDVIIFLDSDMMACPSFVSAHVDAHGDGPGRRPDGSGWVVRGPVVSVPESWDIERTLSARPAPRLGDLSTAFFATGNASVTRDHLLAAGMFDEEFTEYGWEDLELGKRLRSLGLARKWARGAVSYHLKHVTCLPDRNTLCAIRRTESERGRMAALYLRKHPCLRVRLATMAHPLFFALDRLLAPAHWPDGDDAVDLVGALWRSPVARVLVPLVTKIMEYHWYADALRCSLAPMTRTTRDRVDTR